MKYMANCSRDNFWSLGKLSSNDLLQIVPVLAVKPVTAAAAKSLQSCLTLCDPRDGSPPGSPRPWDSPGKNTGVGCLSFSKAWKWKVKVKSLSCVRLLATPWTAAYQAPPSMGFSRQESWSGVPLPSPILTPTFYQKYLSPYFQRLRKKEKDKAKMVMMAGP